MVCFDENIKIIGLREKIIIVCKGHKKEFFARIDTGAAKSSIDENLAKELNLGPSIREIKIRSAHGKSTRPIIKSKIIIANKEMDCEFTIADRAHMHFPLLIGRDIIKQGFLINPSKKNIKKKED
jgi:hypothetical protein